MTGTWSAWHDEYDDPGSPLAIRLAIVIEETRRAIWRCPEGPVRLVSVCAGEGRDAVGALHALHEHPRADDVTAVLVESDPACVAAARQRVADARLPTVQVRQGDASVTDTYAGHVPADVILACGVFGNISDEDIHQTVRLLPQLCAQGATVVWTRHLGPRDGSANLTPQIRAWFREAGFEEVAFRWTPQGYGIGAHRLAAPPSPLQFGQRLFRFLTE